MSNPPATILAIATNAAPTLGDARTGLWLSELTHFLDVIDRAGFAFDLASPAGGAIPLDESSVTPKELADPVNERFMADPKFKAALEGSIPCAEVDPSRYVAIYLSGGHGTMWDFRQSPELQRILTQLYDAGRHLTGVCHGVSGLVDAVDGEGSLLVAGKRVTGFTNFEDTLAGSKKHMPYLLEDALKVNGARFKKNLIPFTSRVEVDGRLITGQNPQSAKAVAEALVKELRAGA